MGFEAFLCRFVVVAPSVGDVINREGYLGRRIVRWSFGGR